jgi:putative lysine transport system permease protein
MKVSLPQAIRNSIPTIGNEWIVNIKDSSVLNVIGVSELYFMSGQAANKNYMFMAAYLTIALIYLVLTLFTTALPSSSRSGRWMGRASRFPSSTTAPKEKTHE